MQESGWVARAGFQRCLLSLPAAAARDSYPPLMYSHDLLTSAMIAEVMYEFYALIWRMHSGVSRRC